MACSIPSLPSTVGAGCLSRWGAEIGNKDARGAWVSDLGKVMDSTPHNLSHLVMSCRALCALASWLKRVLAPAGMSK